MTEQVIDLRSDTVTLPTDKMREAMYHAEVGDSMRGEDPTVNRLEALAAEIMGKEAALFVTSGTQGNLVSLMAHTHHGDEIILEADSHCYYYEVGGFASIAGLSPRFIKGHYGVMDSEEIERAIRPSSPFYPTPRLFVIENTHNRGGGNAIRIDAMANMSDIARRYGLSIHLDGARIFNAAIALGVKARDIAQFADSVQFCLTKGLSAPVGSLIAGPWEFIQRAAKIRKSLGGDLRQSGVLAAAGIIAMEDMVDRLAEDHQNAALLADGLRDLPNLVVDNPPNPTNMVFIETERIGMSAADFVARLRDQDLLAVVYSPYRIRMVTHRHIDAQAVARAIEGVQKVIEEVT